MSRASIAIRILGLTAASVAALVAFGLSPATMAQEKKEHAYVGSRKCKKCHRKQFRSWEKTKMANSFKKLAPNEAAEAKKKAGLDPAKDYQKDKKCVGCHTVGFGKEGGFSFDHDIGKDKARLLGVGCEMCHGPGGDYLGKGKMDKELKNEEIKKKRMPALLAAGFRNKPDKKACALCHQKDSPFFKEFDYEQRVKDGTHEHFKKRSK